MGGRITPGIVMGPCETLSDAGLALLLELGAELVDAHGDRLAPVASILQSVVQARLPIEVRPIVARNT